MRVSVCVIVILTKVKMMMKPLKDNLQGLLLWREMTEVPYRPLHPYAADNCPELVPAGQKYCEKHNKMHPEEVRSASARGYGRRWQKASKAFLNRPENIFCVECRKRGKYVRATVVDHIRPHRGDPKLFWDVSNWRPLCKACHDKKTGREDSNPVYRY